MANFPLGKPLASFNRGRPHIQAVKMSGFLAITASLKTQMTDHHMQFTGYVHEEKEEDKGNRRTLIQNVDDDGRWNNEHAMMCLSGSGGNAQGREHFRKGRKRGGTEMITILENVTGMKWGQDHGDLWEESI